MGKMEDLEELMEKEKRRFVFFIVIFSVLLAVCKFVILSKGAGFLSATLYVIAVCFLFLILESRLRTIKLGERITKKN